MKISCYFLQFLIWVKNDPKSCDKGTLGGYFVNTESLQFLGKNKHVLNNIAKCFQKFSGSFYDLLDFAGGSK